MTEDVRPTELREDVFLRSKQWAGLFHLLREPFPLSLEVKIEGAELGHFANELFRADSKSKFRSNRDYTAPENLLGQKLSRKSDIWSLGCVFYELIKKKKLIHSKRDAKFQLRGPGAIAEAPPGDQGKTVHETEFIRQKDSKMARKLQQALVIHSKVGRIPNYFWKNKRVQAFWEHPVGELVRSSKMLADILECFPAERIEGTQLQGAVQKALFEGQTVGMFVDAMSFFDRLFYKRVWALRR